MAEFVLDADLNAVIGRYSSVYAPVGRIERLGNAGGASGADIWRFVARAGPVGVRAWPVGGMGVEGVEAIHRSLGRLRGLPFIPIPATAIDGRSAVEVGGRAWQVEPWMPGASTRSPTPAQVAGGFGLLGVVHRRLAGLDRVGPSPGLAARLREVEGLRAGGFDALGAALGRGRPSEPRELAGRWLIGARRWAGRVEEELRAATRRPLALQVCLRDARADHLLFEGDRPTGLVDFGAMGVESVAADLARLLSDWGLVEPARRSAAIDAYRAGAPLGDADSRAIAAFEASANLLIGGHWTRWHFLEGRRFDDPSAVLDGLRRGVERVGRLAAQSPLAGPG